MRKIIVVMSQREDFRQHYVGIIRKRYAGHFSIIQMNANRAYDEVVQAPQEVAVLVVGKIAYKLLARSIGALQLPIVLAEEGVSAGSNHGSTYHANLETFESVLERILGGNK